MTLVTTILVVRESRRGQVLVAIEHPVGIHFHFLCMSITATIIVGHVSGLRIPRRRRRGQMRVRDACRSNCGGLCLLRGVELMRRWMTMLMMMLLMELKGFSLLLLMMMSGLRWRL